MYSTKFIVAAVAALAGTSLAQKSDDAYCSSVESSLFYTLFPQAPTTPAAILSAIANNTAIPALPTTLDPRAHQSQLCAIAANLPSSLLPEFQTLGSTLLQFGRDHTSELVAYITDCEPEASAASLTSYLDYVFTATGNICRETPAPAPGTGAPNGTYPTATGSVFPTITTGPTTLIPTAAAARPTGAIMGAAAVGGVLGAAAML